MKWYNALAMVALMALAGCHMIGGPGKSSAPAKVAISGAKGLFLQSGAKGLTMHVARSVMGNDIVTATAATLGAITASGQPQTCDFTDATGATVSVTISQAVQLTANYILFTYAYSGGAGTDTLDMVTGSLAAVSPVPDNWALIFARGTQAWYEAGGGIWTANLASGSTSEISGGGILYGGTTVINSSYPWDSSTTWIYTDSSGNVLIIDLTSGGYISASIVSQGMQTNFGQYRIAYSWGTWLPIGLLDSHYWPIFDPSSGALYLIQNDTNYSTTPNGVFLDVYTVTLNPSTPGVITIGSTPLSSSTVAAAVYGTTNIARQTDMTRTIYSNGPQTWTVAAGGALTSYDTSAVPVVNNGIIGQVLNWQWSGGATYAGPASSQTIDIVQLSGGTGTAAPLVSDPQTIESWSVVGGVLFYTDATGTYQAAVNTATATISTPTLYAGGPVQGITQ